MLDEKLRERQPMTCAVCRDPRFKRLRVEWGCDHEVDEPILRTDCTCNEYTRIVPARQRADGRWLPEERCKLCEGTGEVKTYRCPWSFVGPEERDVVDAALAIEGGMSPFPGVPPDEWPAWLWEGIQVVWTELAAIRRPAEVS